MKVFIPKPNEDWINDVTISEFEAKTRHDIVTDPTHADVIWMYAKWIHDHFPYEILRQRPTITTVHHIVPEKTKSEAFQRFDGFTRIYHVPNELTAASLRSRTSRPITKLPYWINDTKFPPGMLKPIVYGRKITVGSFQRDTEGNDLISPKLEKGPDIFLRVLSGLDPLSVRVILGGWRRQYVISGLKALGIEFEFHERAQDIVSLYSMCDYYLVTSRYEGGPQALLEASQLGIRLLSTPVGIAPEILHPDCVCGSDDEFRTKIMTHSIDHTVGFNLRQLMTLEIDKIVPLYDDLIDHVYAEDMKK